MRVKPRNLVIGTTLILLAGCFVVIAQDSPVNQTDSQKIDNLEQEVENLQSKIRDLRSDTNTPSVDSQSLNFNAYNPPQFSPNNPPQYGQNNQVQQRASYQPLVTQPEPISVYSVNPQTYMNQQLPVVVPPQTTFTTVSTPTQPWVVVQPTYAVPTPIVVVEPTPPCWIDYGFGGPVDPFFPPVGQFGLWFGDDGYGCGKHKHKKHKH